MTEAYSDILDEIKKLTSSGYGEYIEVELKVLSIATRKHKKISMNEDFNRFYGYFYNMSSSNFFTYSLTNTKTISREKNFSLSLRKTKQLKTDIKDPSSEDDIFETTYMKKSKKTFDFEYNWNRFRISVASEIPISEQEYLDCEEEEYERKRQRYSFEFKIKGPNKTPIKKHKADLTIIDSKEFEFEVEFYENFYSNQFEQKLNSILTEINFLITEPELDREPQFKLANPVNLKREHFRSLVNYAITNKLDGQRKQMIFADNGIFLKDSTGYIKVSSALMVKYKRYVLDIEFYRGSIYAFDLILCDGKVDSRDFTERHKDIKDIITEVKRITKDEKGKYNFKDFIFCSVEESVSHSIKKIQEASKHFVNDGFIFVPIYKGYLNRETYKWKPPKQLTVDLMLN